MQISPVTRNGIHDVIDDDLIDYDVEYDDHDLVGESSEHSKVMNCCGRYLTVNPNSNHT